MNHAQKPDGSYRCVAPILADDKLFFYSLSYGSHVVMLKASPEKCTELGRFTPVPALMSYTSPAIAGAKLYLRLRDCVACYDLTAAGNPSTSTSGPEKP